LFTPWKPAIDGDFLALAEALDQLFAVDVLDAALAMCDSK
jgi:hypothetical protein